MPREETLAGKFDVEYQPLAPVLGMFAAGILIDRYCLACENPISSVSTAAWGWFVLLGGSLTLAIAMVSASDISFLRRLWAIVRKISYENKTPTQEKRFWALVAVSLVAVFAFGGLFHHLYWNYYPETEIGFHAETPFSLERVEGKVVYPPQYMYPSALALFSQRETGEEEVVTILQLKIRARKSEKGWSRASGNLVVRVKGRMEDIHVGDTLRMSGRMSVFSESMNPGSFSPKNYYRQQRILAVIQVPVPENPERASRPRFWGVFRTIEFLRDSASRQLERFLTPETKPLATALILGCREEASLEDMNMMMETGTIHIMSISGLHVGLLAGGFFLACRFLGMNRTSTMMAVLFSVWLYVLISGARPPALRAGVIVTISTLGLWLYRRHSSLNTLAAAGIAVLILNPTAIFSTGTQLSFLAVGALYFTPILKENTRKKKGESDEKRLDLAWEYLLVPEAPRREIVWKLARQATLGLLNVLYSSFQMTVILMPLVVKSFHVFAIVGIFLNILLWFPLTLAMMSGAGVVLFGFVPGLGSALGWLCSWSLTIMLDLIRWGAEIPGHCFWLQGMPTFWIFALYTFLILWAVFPALRFRRKKHYALVFGLFLVLALPCWQEHRTKTGELRCSFISVSHGLSILLEFPNGKTILYDAGQFAPPEYPERTISEFLWNLGILRLDAAVISHPDMDHYNAFPGIMERFRIGQFFVSPQMMKQYQAFLKDENARLVGDFSISEENDGVNRSVTPAGRKTQAEIDAETTAMLRHLYSEIKKYRIPVQKIQAGDRIPVAEGCAVSVIHPSFSSLEAEPLKTNANSLVLLLEYEGFRILLTGDLAPPGLDFALAQTPIPCDVVLAPHHGGKTCCTPTFGNWCKPKHLVICDSKNNEQKKTTEIFCEKGTIVHHTGREGAVIFRIKKGKMEVITREEWKEWD